MNWIINLFNRRASAELTSDEFMDFAEGRRRAERNIQQAKTKAEVDHECACHDLARARQMGRGINAAQKAATEALHHRMRMGV